MSATPLTLRRRVALACLLLGLLLSVLFSAAVIAVTEDYEHVLAAEILRGQAEDYSLRLANGLPAQLPLTHRLSGYRGRDLPVRYAGYPLGVTEDEGSDGIHVGVFDTSAGRLAFVIDLRDIEQLERHLNLFLALTALAGTLLAGWLGWMLAGAALAPLGRLAGEVEALPATPTQTRLRDHVSHDELGRLAGAIDDYQARLLDADRHEQAFLADASHELRTPVAVVQGAAEVLLDDAGDDPARTARLQRLERGVQELADLLETLLGIARRKPLRLEPVDAAALLGEAAASVVAGRSGLVVDVDASGMLLVPRREALLLLRAGLRWLCGGADGTLSLRLRGNALDLAFSGVGRADADAPVRSDTGQLSTLTRRLAQRLGWDIASSGHGRIGFRLPVRAA
jgi:signal transduction histidine kinase